MGELFGFAVPGLTYGCAYALFAVGLVLTYQTTGVLNFGYGAQAYASAFFFTWLTQDRGLPTWLAAVLAVGVLGPGLGLLFDRALFRRIPAGNTTATMVTGLCLLVGIPALVPVIFGNVTVVGAPSIAWNPDTVYFHLFGLAQVPVDGTELSAVVCTAVVLVGLTVLLRATPLGLRMRASVESRRLMELEGIDAGRVLATSWGVCGLMAGLAGVVLAATQVSVSPEPYIALMVAAIAAAACAVLRSLPLAALAGVAIGVVGLTARGYLPTGSFWYTAVIPALPFLVLAAALLVVPGLRHLDEDTDPLAGVEPPPPPPEVDLRSPEIGRMLRAGTWLLGVALVVSMLTWMPRAWEGVLNQGVAYSVLFLSITLLTGTAGQLSLAQATLAGVGAYTAGQLAQHLGLNLLVGGVIGALAAAGVAAMLAVGSLRLRGLGLALMTLAAALLFDSAVFSQTAVSGGTAGIALLPSWAGLGLLDADGHAYFVVSACVLAVCTAAVVLIQRGTTGRFLTAMRGSELAAAGVGVNLHWERIVVFSLSGALAGLGGTLLALQQGVIAPGQYGYQLSLAFVVIVVTTGAGSVEGALQAGFGFVVVQKLLQYAPERYQGLTFVLFAAGALTYARHPEGMVEYHKRRWIGRADRLVARRRPAGAVAPGGV